MPTPSESASKIGLSLSADGSHLRASPEVKKHIISSSYSQAYEVAFGQASPYISLDREAMAKRHLEQRGFTVTLVKT